MKDLKGADFSAKDLKGAGFSLKDLVGADGEIRDEERERLISLGKSLGLPTGDILG